MGPTTTRRWAYACAKALDEFLALAHWHETRLPVVVARLFNTVGPRQTGRYGMVIPRFVAQGLAGEPITVYGDGTQTRCFAHVADVVGALVRLMGRPEAAGQVFNVGNDEEITILELAERVRALTGGRSPIRLVPYGEAYTAGFEDMVRRVPDLTKIRRLIGYRPTRDLDQILADVLAELEKGETGPHQAGVGQTGRRTAYKTSPWSRGALNSPERKSWVAIATWSSAVWASRPLRSP